MEHKEKSKNTDTAKAIAKPDEKACQELKGKNRYLSLNYFAAGQILR